MGTRRSAILLAGGATMIAAGCSSEPVAPTPSTSTTTAGCPDVSGQPVARSGELSAGPFTAEAIGPPPPTAPAHGKDRKVWVASQRSGHDDALLTLTPPSSTTARTYRRPAGMASAPNAAQFYPGLIEISAAGTWRLTITVGADRMCVRITYAV